MHEQPVVAHGAAFLRREDLSVWLRFDPTTTALPALIADISARYAVTDFSIVEPDLEQVIGQIYEAREVA